MYEIAKVGGYLLSPLTLALGLGLLGAVSLGFRRRRTGLALAAIAFAILWAGSLPIVAQTLIVALESRYPAYPPAQAPSADAIVVLGGAVTGRYPPKRPSLGLHSGSNRIWHAAELYRAGKAQWIVLAAGGEPDFDGQPSEAEAITEMLQILGVPRSAIQWEAQSRNTRENAFNVRPILQRLGAKRVLLVTSALHMPRAMKTFEKVWAHSEAQLLAAPSDVQIAGPVENGWFMWIPSPNALFGVTKALKEYAGMAALAII